LKKENLVLKAKKIKLVIMDVDGVMTDRRIILTSNGEELKSFDVRDGYGITMLHKAGIETAIISARFSKVTDLRAKELEIKTVYQGNLKKIVAYEEIVLEKKISDQEIAYIGDDIVDYEIMQKVGLSIAVGDALPFIKKKADLVTKNSGGKGAIREAIEFILKAKGLLVYPPKTEDSRV
jgi:3-deoxy-D-manno-octulosonate 8-phosphate phosphatase (KDO 8-P phosphatase)